MKKHLLLLLLLVVVGVALGLLLRLPRVSEEVVRQAVVTTIQQEAPASFFITGYLDITATSTVESTRYLFPDLMAFDLGTTRASVRMPGRVSYGFDVTDLRAEDIQVREDDVVEVTLPSLQLYAVEPVLEKMEVETTVGWARLYASSGREAEHQAIRYVREALREQALQHLNTATQPQINTARAIETLLRPALQATGLKAPHFRIYIGPDLVLQPEG